MSDLTLSATATALKFSTDGLTGSGGAACIQGHTSFALYGGASYFANGSFNIGLGASRGLINNVKFGTGNVSAATGCVVTDNGTAIGLGTAGITGNFTVKILHPQQFTGRPINTCWGPKYTEILMKINKGIIYGWYTWDCYQAITQGGALGTLTRTEMEATETTPGVFVADSNATSIGFASGLTGSPVYYYVYDVYFFTNSMGLWWVKVFYGTISFVLSGGLLKSISGQPDGWLQYYI